MDKNRILAKIDELDSYLREIKSILPHDFEFYLGEKKRACERLLHLLIETSIDICALIVKDLRLGVPSEEEDLFSKLESIKTITKSTANALREMKKFRNLLIPRYSKLDDRIVYRNLKNNLADFLVFKKEILKFVKRFRR